MLQTARKGEGDSLHLPARLFPKQRKPTVRCRNHCDFRAEAMFTKHLLKHKPCNKYSEACLKSKRVELKHMVGSYNRDPKRWGDIITADHSLSRQAMGRSAWLPQ